MEIANQDNLTVKVHGQWGSGALGTESRERNRAVLFVLAGERRRGALNLRFASPPVATRNGLAPPARIGAPVSSESSEAISNPIAHGACIASCTSLHRSANHAKTPEKRHLS